MTFRERGEFDLGPVPPAIYSSRDATIANRAIGVPAESTEATKETANLVYSEGCVRNCFDMFHWLRGLEGAS